MNHIPARLPHPGNPKRGPMALQGLAGLSKANYVQPTPNADETPMTDSTHHATAADYQIARAALRGCQAQLRAAYLDAHSAAPHLTGVRAARACELADEAADALAHCERLIFIVADDLHAGRAGARDA